MEANLIPFLWIEKIRITIAAKVTGGQSAAESEPEHRSHIYIFLNTIPLPGAPPLFHFAYTKAKSRKNSQPGHAYSAKRLIPSMRFYYKQP